MMFAIATLLSPTIYECVNPDLFGSLEGPVSDICMYDWSGAVADKLVLCIERFNEKGCTGALGGCLLVPVVSFISLVLFSFLLHQVLNSASCLLISYFLPVPVSISGVP